MTPVPGASYRLKSGVTAVVDSVAGDVLTYRIPPITASVRAKIARFKTWVTGEAS